MPIIVNPDVPNPPAAVTATSDDQILTATAYPFGIYLDAAFPSLGNVVPDPKFTDNARTQRRFGAGVTVANGVATVPPNLNSARLWLVGDKDRSTSTAAPDPGAGWQDVTPGQNWTGSYEATVPTGTGFTMRAQMNFLLADGSRTVGYYSPVITAPRSGVTAVISVTAKAPDDAVGVAFAAVGSGSQASFGATIRNPKLTQDPPAAVRFTRLPDIAVRSGRDRPAIGGVAHALDSEAPRGQAAQWTATPVYTDGTLGHPSLPVLLTPAAFPGPESAFSCWVQALSEPNLQGYLVGLEPLPEFSREAVSNLSTVAGSSYPAGSYGPTMARTTQLSFVTRSRADEELIEKIFTAGPVFIQFDPSFGLRDGYCQPGTLSRVAIQRQDFLNTQWQVELTEIARPSPIGAPLVVPGRSYAETGRNRTYAQFGNVFPTYADAARPA